MGFAVAGPDHECLLWVHGNGTTSNRRWLAAFAPKAHPPLVESFAFS
jgi:hypothetical protein